MIALLRGGDNKKGRSGGAKAGKLLEDGKFEADSINDRVQKRLVALAQKLRDFTRPEEEAKKGSRKNS